MKILGRATKLQLEEERKVLKQYICRYCGTEFKQYVGKSGSRGGSKHKNVSSQVKCPECKNFLKTW